MAFFVMAPIPPDDGNPLDQLTILVKRAEAGYADALSELRVTIANPSHQRTKLQRLAADAKFAWVTLMARGVFREENILADLTWAADRLVQPEAGPLEKLLAEQVALAEARLQFLRGEAEQAVISGQSDDLVKELSRRSLRAERDHGAAQRLLRDVRERLPL